MVLKNRNNFVVIYSSMYFFKITFKLNFVTQIHRNLNLMLKDFITTL